MRLLAAYYLLSSSEWVPRVNRRMTKHWVGKKGDLNAEISRCIRKRTRNATTRMARMFSGLATNHPADSASQELCVTFQT